MRKAIFSIFSYFSFSFSVWAVYNLIRIYSYVNVDYMVEGWSRHVAFLGSLNSWLIYSGYVFLVLLFFVYSLFHFLRKKKSVLVSVLKSLGYAFVGFVLLFLTSGLI